MKIKPSFILILLICGFNACKNPEADKMKNELVSVTPSPSVPDPAAFTDTLDGRSIALYTLKNKDGMEIRLTNYGASIVSILMKDRDGKWADIALGYDSLQGYRKGKSYFGAIVGRYANRIAKGRFSLNGQKYTLSTNNGPNSLHGGKRGFDKVAWEAEESTGSIRFHYFSRDGEEGYPGNLDVEVTYTLSDSNTLAIDYKATTDRSTVLNISNHTYFNLRGQGNGDILGHQLQLFADSFTPVDSTLIPTGEVRKVAGTAFDFTTPHTIGERVGASDEQITFGKGYDHNFVLTDRTSPGSLRAVAKVTEPESGRMMQIFSTEPAVQFYCGNFLDGSEMGKGSVYEHRTGFCLETQHYPDSPNQPSFPTVVLKPGQTYGSRTVYVFSVVK
jgi:aldose 1-epimerase